MLSSQCSALVKIILLVLAVYAGSIQRLSRFLYCQLLGLSRLLKFFRKVFHTRWREEIHNNSTVCKMDIMWGYRFAFLRKFISWELKSINQNRSVKHKVRKHSKKNRTLWEIITTSKSYKASLKHNMLCFIRRLYMVFFIKNKLKLKTCLKAQV